MLPTFQHNLDLLQFHTVFWPVQKRAMVENPSPDKLKDPFAAPAPMRKPQPVQQQQTEDAALKPATSKMEAPKGAAAKKIPQNPKKQKKMGRGAGGRGKSSKSGKSGKK